MLYKLRDLSHTTLRALDGDVGKVRDVYFDDLDWVVRYLVADTGGWFSGRKVLLSPASVDRIGLDGKEISMNLTKRQIEDSPPVLTDEPVSRRMEARLVQHYGWPAYWTPPFPPMSAPDFVPAQSAPWGHPPDPDDQPLEPVGDVEDQGLRSANEVRGYGIRTGDGDIGQVDDFVCDPEDWRIHYLVVDTRRILPGKKVLVPSGLVGGVSWEAESVLIASTKEALRTAPQYEEGTPLDAAMESTLRAHYGRSSAPVRGEGAGRRAAGAPGEGERPGR